MIANKCDPDDRQCQNVRRYYQSDFKRPNPYDKVPTPAPTANPPPPDTPGPAPTPPAPNPAPTPPAPNPTPNPPEQPNDSKTRFGTLPRPLKKMSSLTPEQIDKGRMVAASYEFDHRINKEMQYTGKQNATDNILLRDSDKIMKKTQLSDWKVMQNLSDKQYLVLEKGNDLKIVFRGRAGDNPVDNQHVGETLRGKTRNYEYLDQLMGEIQLARPNANIEVVSYSNGGPKGLYLAEKYGLDHYSIDPVLGPKEVKLLTARDGNSAKLELVRTNKPALASGMGQTAVEILTGKTPANTEVINVAPLKATSNPLVTSLPDYAHKTDHYALMDDDLNVIPESERGKVGLIGKNALGSVVSGVAPAALASVLVESTTPDAPEEAKLAETAVGASVLTKGISPLVGAGAAPIASTILPMYVSMEAADKTSKIVDAIIPDDMHDLPREVLKGGASGAAAGTAFGVTSAAQSAAATALTSATTTTVAAAEGVEMAALGVGAAEATEGLTLLGALAAGGTGAVEGGGATSEFGPLAAAGAFVGGLTGAGIYLLTGGKKKEKNEEPENHDPWAEQDEAQEARENEAKNDSAKNFERLLAIENRSEKEQNMVDLYTNLATTYPKDRPQLASVLNDSKINV